MNRLALGVMNRLSSDKTTVLLPVTLICGIVTIVSVYLTWVGVPLYDNYTLPISGWKMIIWAGSIGESYAEPYLVLFGGIMILACSLPALVISLVTRQQTRIARDLGMGMLLGAGLSFAGILWFAIRALSSEESGWLGAGFYGCAVSIILALAFNIWNAVKPRRVSLPGARSIRDVISGPLAVMACGFLTLAGLFMPWIRVSSGGIASETSGWGLTRFNLTGVLNPEPYLVLAGSIMMLACGILLTIAEVYISQRRVPCREAKYILWVLGGLAYGSGALVVGGAMWFALQAVGDVGAGAIGWGIYIAIVAAVAGALVGLRTSARIVRQHAGVHQHSDDR